MSYTLQTYLVDLEKLTKAVGSRDESLVSAILEKKPVHAGADDDEDVDDDEEGAEDEEEDDGEISMKQALQDLVMGNKRDEDSAHVYGYALEQLCRHLGTPAKEQDMWCGIRWSVLEITGLDEILSRSGSPVPLPEINDFPTIGHLTREQVSSLVTTMGDGHLPSAAPSGQKPGRSLKTRLMEWLLNMVVKRLTGHSMRGPISPDEVRPMLDEYEGWLREAASQKKSLVFFYY